MKIIWNLGYFVEVGSVIYPTDIYDMLRVKVPTLVNPRQMDCGQIRKFVDDQIGKPYQWSAV